MHWESCFGKGSGYLLVHIEVPVAHDALRGLGQTIHYNTIL